MELLPILEYPTENYIKKKPNYNLKELCEIIKDCVSGSCYAIIVNNEIIYNYYNLSRKPSEIILQDINRDYFIENPYLLISSGNKIDIYMFCINPWRININCFDKFYKVSCFN